MIEADPVPEVSADELLARYVLYSSHVRGNGKGLKPDAFMPHPYKSLSVTRHLHAENGELWLVGQAVAIARQRQLYGRGDLGANSYGAENLRVSADPIDGNPNHVEVHQWPSDKPTQKEIALKLAAVCDFVPAP